MTEIITETIEDTAAPEIKLACATRNRGKITELKDLLADTDITLMTWRDFAPVGHIEETGKTFAENAIIKAATTAKILGVPALADDSGLIVRALNNAPGVYSARYASDDASDWDNLQKVLHEMRGVTDRRAAFKCFIAIARPDGEAITFGGSCDGAIAPRPRGSSGFGYDPIFLCGPFLRQTFAELTDNEKNLISHRAKALGSMYRHLDRVRAFLNYE